jgi:shikimate dehydrogenase
MSKKFTIFGNPVEHSISPKMHSYAIDELGLKATYSKFKLEDGDRLKEEFLSQNLDGANVTLPHKEIAFNLCDEVRGIAKDIKAVNTLVLEDGKMIGYNSDAEGFLKSIEEFGSIKKVLIIGAGGTAKAIATILKNRGYNISILNRSKKRLESFQESGFETFCWDDFKISNYDLVVNTTSAGLKDSSYPLPKNILEEIFKNTKYAVDVIYNIDTPFLQLAKKFNIKTKDGLDMLIYQGVIAFNLFYNNRFSEIDIADSMKKALQ